jgi:hypothetical protein
MYKLCFLISLILLSTSASNQNPNFLNLKDQEDNYIEAFKGFIKAVKIFDDLPHQATCEGMKILEHLFNDFGDIFIAFVQLEYIERVPEMLKIIAEKTIDMWKTLKNEVDGECGLYVQEMGDVLNNFYHSALTKEYVLKFALHSVTNLKEIDRLHQNYEKKIKHLNEELGLAFGEFLNFTFFWDFKK